MTSFANSNTDVTIWLNVGGTEKSFIATGRYLKPEYSLPGEGFEVDELTDGDGVDYWSILNQQTKDEVERLAINEYRTRKGWIVYDHRA